MADAVVKEKSINPNRIYGDYLIMLIIPCVLAVWYYGIRSLYVIAASVVSAVLTEAAANLVIEKRFYIKDISSFFTGAAIAMMMPAGISYYIPVFAAFFGVATAKIPFGSALKTPFVPAAAGFAFASVCFKEQVFSYTVNTSQKLLGANSLGSLLAKGVSVRINSANIFDIIGGNVSGPMGTGCVLVMLGCCAFLLIRRPKALFSTAGFVVAAALGVLVLPRLHSSYITNLVLELSSGSLLFGAVFLLTDYATLPPKNLNKFIYGVICGLICVGMRYLGAYEETVCFAILLTNGFRPIFDSALNNIPKLRLKRPFKKEAETR